MLIKKIFIALIIIILFPVRAVSAYYPETSAKSAILINVDTKEILYEKNAYEFLPMASTTKIMTSILAVESGEMYKHVIAEKDYNCEGTAIAIKKGDTFTLETLIYAMLLESGNDAAELTADFLSGSQLYFADMMNQKAKDIGMTSTCFVTSSGLDAKNHGTTAYDMALLGAYAINNPVFKRICSTERATVQYISPNKSSTFVNHNRLLREYAGIIGIKTGFTKKSGRCLVTACEKNKTTLVAVTLKAPDDWNDHKKLYDYGFSAISKTESSVKLPSSVKVYGSECKTVNIIADTITLRSASDVKTEYKINLKKWVYAPIKKGDILGTADILIGKKTVKTVYLRAAEDVEALSGYKKPIFSIVYKIKQFLKFERLDIK